MVLNGERHIVAQEIERLQFLFVIEGIAFATPKRDCSNQPAANSQRSHAAKQFGRNVAVRAKKGIVGGSGEQHRTLGRTQGMHVTRQQRDDRGLGYQSETRCCDRTEHGRLFDEYK